MTLLSVAAADPLTPGSNRRVGAAASAWLLLLPNLRLRRVVIDGRVDATTREALSLVADVVVDGREGDEVADAADLVVVGRGGDVDAARRRAREGRPVYLAAGLVPEPGIGGGSLALAPAQPDANDAPGEFHGPAGLAVPLMPLDLTPVGRRFEQATRVVDRASRRFGLRRRAPASGSGPLALVDAGIPDARRPGWLLGLEPATLRHPPAWLIELATGAGIDIADDEWTFVPGGAYWSQKAVFLLRGPGQPAAGIAVKIARHPALAARLDVERRALDHLTTRTTGKVVVPCAIFSGCHRGMEVLAETAVTGTSLVDLVTADPGCPATASALDALLELAVGGDAAREAPPAEAADALAGVVDRFAAAYPRQAGLAARLRSCVAAVEASASPFPSVFQHGDAGIWNLVRTDSGDIGVLDWENADPAGMPLWDLFYFVQTRGSRLAAARGTRYTAAAFANQLLRPSPHSALLARQIGRWRAATRLDQELVGPLFHLWLAHQAVKEAAQSLYGRRRERGRSLQLLARAVEAPALPFEADGR